MARLRALLGEVSFHRGLALGALVGSAIAGSTLWARIREARRPPDSGDDAAAPVSPAMSAQSPDAVGKAPSS